VKIEFAELARTKAPWLAGDGDLAETVISSRIRLARNLARMPYPSISNAKQQSEVIEAVAQVAGAAFKSGSFLRARELDTTDRQILVERHLTSPEFMRDNTELAVFVEAGEKTSVTVNEEDHLRIQALTSGLSLQLAWERAQGSDATLDLSLTLDFDREFGYLTACPTNVGTGLRASVLVHLPALVLTREIESYLMGRPEVLLFAGSVGGGSAANSGQAYVNMREQGDRPVDAMGDDRRDRCRAGACPAGAVEYRRP